ncbi:MAG: / ComM-related protein [Hydrocarboniphaga sp.]|uniref:YifB family Mg chelatase-like AAA ATPase n=1 Tax=Hydrocarboniphaga sp. TaxID=2033016 RepID=UPI002602068C|nr:YifB family Mg chelatase-like AAA ATPase [Hydrocarboniphaga sp.]MDB5968314.1 / ComM-related protein [Hydrocarboniphaga sp.]
MSLATVLSRAQNGLTADLVRVEVHLANGLPGLAIVGLPEAAVREAKDRVKAAITTCGYEFPARRITCNLAPADLPKEGGRFDLAIALGILAASQQIPAERLAGLEVLGELSLSGELRAVRGALPAALQAKRAGHALIVPLANADEAVLAAGVRIIAARHLSELCGALHAGELAEYLATNSAFDIAVDGPDLAEVRGQPMARRALEIAAAGGHSLLMVGPPGSGKSMLAARLPGLLPPMSEDEAIQVAAIASVATSGFDPRNWRRRPFRSPHHTASGVALVGGGSSPRPGEITLAHLGILFLDEIPEFDRRVLEVLRQPLETGEITISRAAQQQDFPARFQLIAAMNPCPCGFLGDPESRCRCTPDQVARYRGRISGPLLDRIDLQIFVPRIERQALLQPAVAVESSADVRVRVSAARERQMQRAGKPNVLLNATELERDCALDAATRALIEAAMQRLRLSARGYHRVLRVSRTIADLAHLPTLTPAHVAEALRYREFERSGV